jgi:microcin C transport system permease protein
MTPTQRRLRAFFKQTRTIIGLIIFGFFFVFSMTAEIWSESKPIIFVRDFGDERGTKTFFPAFKNYPVADFGVEDFDINFETLIQEDKAAGRESWGWFPINRFNPYQQDGDIQAAPSAKHWLGTDNLGRDVVARLIYGVRVSLLYGLGYWLFTFLIGITVGSLQGYFASVFDFLMERGKEVIELLPFLSIVILVNGIVKADSFWVTLGVVVSLSWISISAQVRAQFLALRKREFCEAAKVAGAGHTRIIFKHILPNALTPILTYTPFAIAQGIGILTVLDFLGFGLNPPTPSLGELLQQGRAAITSAPWILLSPTIALILVLISINLIGESLRKAFDPKAL